MTIANRLKYICGVKGIDGAAELRRRTGLNVVTLGAYLRGDRNPPLDVCEVIGDALGYHGRWIYDDSGPREIAGVVISSDDTSVTLVPLVDEVTAGQLVEPSSQIPTEDLPKIALANLGPGEFFALRVRGNSMDRLSPEGSVIVVDRRDRHRVSGRCYVFAVKGETTYKRWQDGETPFLEPYSTDPTHKPVFVKRKRDVDVIGRVKRTFLDL